MQIKVSVLWEGGSQHSNIVKNIPKNVVQNPE